MTIGFAREAIEAVEYDWEKVKKFNEALHRLQKRQRQIIKAEEDLGRSTLAWKIAVFQQAILYRIVMLASGSAEMWNTRNVLGAILCVRALIESGALLYDFKQQLIEFSHSKNLQAIDDLVNNRTFSTKLEDWLKEAPDAKATNILTFIQRLDKLIEGVEGHYNRLSEICHPNSLGHYMTFAALNKETREVTFSEVRRFDSKMLTHIMAGFFVLLLTESILNKIDNQITLIADIQAAA